MVLASLHQLHPAANRWLELFMLDTCGLAVIIITALFSLVVLISVLSGSAVLTVISLPGRWRKQAALAQQQKLRESTDTQYLITELQSKDFWTRHAAIKRLGELGDPVAVEALITPLLGDDAWLAIEAAEALGKIGDHRAVPPLIQTLHSTEQRQALENLFENAKTERDGSLAWGLLTEAEDLDSLRVASARALAVIGDIRAIPALKLVIEDQTDHYQICELARELLAKFDIAENPE